VNSAITHVVGHDATGHSSTAFETRCSSHGVRARTTARAPAGDRQSRHRSSGLLGPRQQHRLLGRPHRQALGHDSGARESRRTADAGAATADADPPSVTRRQRFHVEQQPDEGVGTGSTWNMSVPCSPGSRLGDVHVPRGTPPGLFAAGHHVASAAHGSPAPAHPVPGTNASDRREEEAAHQLALHRSPPARNAATGPAVPPGEQPRVGPVARRTPVPPVPLRRTGGAWPGRGRRRTDVVPSGTSAGPPVERATVRVSSDRWIFPPFVEAEGPATAQRVSSRAGSIYRRRGAAHAVRTYVSGARRKNPKSTPEVWSCPGTWRR